MAQKVEAIAECPSCAREVPLDAPECPHCGELFADESAEEAQPEAEVAEPAVGPAEASKDEPREPKKAGLREKLLFYAGVALVLIGGPGIALGSWIHDVLRIPFNEYTAFDVFGSMNRLVSALGLIVLIIGIVFLILSLRLTRPAETDDDLGAPGGA